MQPQLSASVSPHGRVFVEFVSDELNKPMESTLAQRLMEAFQESPCAGLTLLASKACDQTMHASLEFWRRFAETYFQAVCRTASQETTRWTSPQAPSSDDLLERIESAPTMRGFEYLTMECLTSREGMTLLRGQWVQVDQKRLNEALDQWTKLESQHASGIGFLEGLRLLSGTPLGDKQVDDEVRQWTRVEAGDWLHEILDTLRNPSGVIQLNPNQGLNATLRNYQVDGVRWLWFTTQLGLGACLADDMGSLSHVPNRSFIDRTILTRRAS